MKAVSRRVDEPLLPMEEEARIFNVPKSSNPEPKIVSLWKLLGEEKPE